MGHAMRRAARQNTVSASITDSFDRADSTTTMGTTDTGQTWVPNTGTWGISSNRAYVVSGSQATTVVESNLADCTIQVTAAVVGNGGLCWRSTNNSNHWLMAPTVVFKKVAGGFTQVGASFSGLTNGTVIKIILSGNDGYLYFDGVLKLSWSDSFNATATKHGLRELSGGGSARFDSFSIVP